jgi:uncharacterized protein involved in exopolysaccharide biosynthesis
VTTAFTGPVRAVWNALQQSWMSPYFGDILRDWRTVFMYALLAGLATGAIVFVVPDAYVARASLVIDTPDKTTLPSGIAQFAGQLGLLGLEDQNRSPMFYRDLMSSRRVLTSLLTTSIQGPGGGNALEPVYRVYDRTADSLSPRETEELLRRLNRRLQTTVDARTGAIRVALEGPTAREVAETLDSLLSLTNAFAVTNLRSRARARRQFAEAQVSQAKVDLEQSEDSLRQFYERNRRIADAPALQFEEARLRRRIDLRQEIYLTLNRELEQARLDEVRDTPILNVIDPPVPPARHEKPQRRVLTIIGAFFGALAAIAGIVIQRSRRYA